METVLLVIHLMLAIALIGVVLLQKSEGGGLGIGGGGMSGFMSGRSTANLLTRTTAILATCFMVTSLALAWLVAGPRQPQSILDAVPAPFTETPAETQPLQEPAPPSAPQPSEPQSSAPSVPLGE